MVGEWWWWLWTSFTSVFFLCLRRVNSQDNLDNWIREFFYLLFHVHVWLFIDSISTKQKLISTWKAYESTDLHSMDNWIVFIEQINVRIKTTRKKKVRKANMHKDTSNKRDRSNQSSLARVFWERNSENSYQLFSTLIDYSTSLLRIEERNTAKTLQKKRRRFSRSFRSMKPQRVFSDAP